MTDIQNEIIPADKILECNEKRRTMVWYSDVSCYYEGLVSVAHMYNFFVEHSAEFHDAVAKDIWKAYTSDYYKMISRLQCCSGSNQMFLLTIIAVRTVSAHSLSEEKTGYKLILHQALKLMQYGIP